MRFDAVNSNGNERKGEEKPILTHGGIYCSMSLFYPNKMMASNQWREKIVSYINTGNSAPGNYDQSKVVDDAKKEDSYQEKYSQLSDLFREDIDAQYGIVR